MENDTSQNNIARCDFIENKVIDFTLLELLLTQSKNTNHWANYGPASIELENHLSEALKINKTQKIIVCKSATDALFILTNIKAIKKKKPLKWVISSFGFISTNIGPLANATIIDCQLNGLISLKELKELPPHSWDGLIITNVFGLFNHFEEYIKLCHELNKEIIIDNALGFHFKARENTNSPNEIISLHQTKPWGMGEGGCLVINKDDEDLSRALINFGVGLEPSLRVYASNSKLADINAALILQRLYKIKEWEPKYIEQTLRVSETVDKLSLHPLSPLPKHYASGQLPILSLSEVSTHTIIKNNSPIQFGKYHCALSDTTKNALRIYKHILNIPCHSDMIKLSDIQIKNAIENILDMDQL